MCKPWELYSLINFLEVFSLVVNIGRRCCHFCIREGFSFSGVQFGVAGCESRTGVDFDDNHLGVLHLLFHFFVSLLRSWKLIGT